MSDQVLSYDYFALMLAQTSQKTIGQLNEKHAYKLMNVSVWHLMSGFICIV